MAASTIQALVDRVRQTMSAVDDPYWSDQELADLMNDGISDLWQRINELYKNYFVIINDDDVSLPANATSLDGVPDDCYKVVSIEPRVVGPNNPNPGLVFTPRDYNSPDFVNARASTVREPNNCVVFYTVMQQGPPIDAPLIVTAPPLSSAVLLKVVYNLILETQDLDDGVNPIPGGSDRAVIAYTIAHARAKERSDNSPDPTWLKRYENLKAQFVENLTPRQTQEPTYVEGMFEGM